MTEESPLEGWKRQLTALEQGINPLVKAATAVPEAGDDLETLLVQQEILTSLYDQACNTILKIEGQTGPSKRRDTLLPIYVQARTNFARRIRRLQATQNEGAAGGSSRALLDQTMIAGNTRSDHLPRLELPKFHGSATEWLSFKARFDKRVATLTEDANKYAFLSKCLEYEPARNTCEALENSGLPFHEAWDKLEERFYKKRIAFEGYFFNLLKIKKIAKPTQRAILALVDAVDTLLSATKQIANEEAGNLDCIANGLLVCLVKERLDELTLSKIEEKMDLQKIYNWAEFKLELERLANQLTCKAAAEAAHANQRPQQRSSAAASIKAPAHKEKGNAQRCFFCTSDGHTVFMCPTFTKMDVPERWESVKSGRHCFNCLLQGHSTKICKSTKRCQTCNGKHHSLLHREDTLNKMESKPDSTPGKDVVQASTSSSSK